MFNNKINMQETPKIEFGYDIDKDVWSWVLIAKSVSSWGMDTDEQVSYIPTKLLNSIKENSFEKAVEITKEYIENHPKREYRELVINQTSRALEKVWQSKEEAFFKVLSEITQKPIYAQKFGAYATSGFMCPYKIDEDQIDWFMFSIWHSLPFSITTICHELMHFQFLHYWENSLKQSLQNKQVENLKESLTFLLNQKEFENIILSEDQGYPDHQKLRNYLESVWKKEKNFSSLVESGVKFIKDNSRNLSN